MKRLLFIGLLASQWAYANPMILTTEDAPPTNFTTDGGKTIIGSATEQIHELFKRAEIPYTIKMYPWQRAIDMAEQEKNTCVYSTTRTEDREKKFLWVGPVAPNDWVLFALADSKIELKTLDDARKYKVGGYRGDAVAEYLEAQKFKLDNATNDEQSLKKLMAGGIDIWATGILAGPWTAKKQNAKIKLLLNFKKTELYLACNLGVPQATIDKLNATLAGMAKDGTTAKINKKYQ
ncbi:MAG: ABC transporter substrate-binding protein [Rhodocyclaceae bacterium]|jgi:polar amino acid transport system substrate-binding protein|nr:ABC transporter substrate-binding protein [Rhodocyclaceae bacterium]MBK6907276.1 ABC transporter substrate-binding protein [Rhodocyclaceae bacterium]